MNRQQLERWGDLHNHLYDFDDDDIDDIDQIEEIFDDDIEEFDDDKIEDDDIIKYRIDRKSPDGDRVDVIFQRADGTLYQSHRFGRHDFRANIYSPEFISFC